MRMRVLRLGCVGLSAALLAAALSRPAGAELGADKPGAIVAFPHVVATLGRDTIIQLSSAAYSPVTAHCFYVNGTTWQTIDFFVELTPQQPVYWVASEGRKKTPLIPPVGLAFRGELLCIAVDDAVSDTPAGHNALMGVATLKTTQRVRGNRDVAKYNAIAFTASDALNSDRELVLGEEYDGCPAAWTLNLLAEGAQDPLLGAGSSVSTRLTVVPCAHDFETQTPQTVALAFRVYGEMEEVLSQKTTVQCWKEFGLAGLGIFDRAVIGSDFVHARILTPTTNSAGFLVVAQESHKSGGPAAVTVSAAVNAYAEGTRDGTDSIILPMALP